MISFVPQTKPLVDGFGDDPLSLTQDGYIFSVAKHRRPTVR